MSEPKHLMDEADIGSGEQEIANEELLKDDIRKVPSNQDAPDRDTTHKDGAPTKEEGKVGTT